MIHAGSVVLLLVVATVVSLVARRLRIPYTVGLVVAGLALGATHLIVPPALTRELLFTLILPGLIFDAAFNLHIEEFRRDAVTLVSLAVPGVIAAIAIVVLVLGPVMTLFGVDAPEVLARHGALVFAALISATDPVAVVALFRSLDAPRRLQVLIEGESLLNDGTAIIFFTLVLGTSAGGIGASAFVVTDFVYVVGAGVIVGALIGALVDQGIRRLHDPTVEVMLTTIAAYGSFVAAEGVGASGVIATVTAGMLCGSSDARSSLSVPARMAVATFWEYWAFALNSLVFLMIGFVIRVPMLIAHWQAILAAYVVVTFSRAIVTTGLAAVLPSRLRLPRQWVAILAWGGLRGALSMVLALSIPESFPQRDLLITMTFGVVILSILAQGITVGPALRWLGLTRPMRAPTDYDETRMALLSAHSALSELDRTGNLVVSGEGRDVLAAEYEQRIRGAERELGAIASHVADGPAGAAAPLASRRLLYVTERQRVLDAFHAGGISRELSDRLIRDLDALWWDVRSDASPDQSSR
ncbi:MAG TPA: sodium:proton antiporter [Gemmatimonadaceae bacterium]|nr:sodium:proton antiporter [Gemmatimonadaceae bacterium]